MRKKLDFILIAGSFDPDRGVHHFLHWMKVSLPAPRLQKVCRVSASGRHFLPLITMTRMLR